MKSINVRWRVPFGPEFGPRWQLAPDIWNDCFDFTQDPLPLGLYTGQPDEIFRLNWAKGIHDLFTRPANPLEDVLERIFVMPELKSLDRRVSVFDTLAALEQRVITLKRML